MKPVVPLLSFVLGMAVPLYAAPDVSSFESAFITQSARLAQADQYEAAQRLLEDRLAGVGGVPSKAADKVLLQNALADLHYRWAGYLRQPQSLNAEAAIRHYLTAYETDKTLRPLNAGRDLTEVGGTHYDQQRYEEALKYWQLALAIKQEIKDRPDEAHTFDNIGFMYLKLGRPGEAIKAFQASLLIRRELKERGNEAWLLQTIGDINVELKQYPEAIDSYSSTLTVYHGLGNHDREPAILQKMEEALKQWQLLPNTNRTSNEARIFFNGGSACYETTHFEEALRYYNLALSIYREQKDKEGEARTLAELGPSYERTKRYEEALQANEQALSLFQELKDRTGEARTLYNRGIVFFNGGHTEDAIQAYSLALPIYHELQAKSSEASTHYLLGRLYDSTQKTEEAQKHYELALSLYRETKERAGEARLLGEMGDNNKKAKRYDVALDYYQQALPIFHGLQDNSGEAKALSQIGEIHNLSGNDDKTIAAFQQAVSLYAETGNYEQQKDLYSRLLPLFVKRNDKAAQENVAFRMGDILFELDDNEGALSSYQQAYSLLVENNNPSFKAEALYGMGKTQSRLRRYRDAASSFEKAKLIWHELNQPDREGGLLRNIGLAYSQAGLYENSISAFKQALALFRKKGDKPGQASTLFQIGKNYKSWMHYTEALSAYLEACTLNEELGDTLSLRTNYSEIAYCYENFSSYDKAIPYRLKAIDIARQVRDIGNETIQLRLVSTAYTLANQPEEAARYSQLALDTSRQINREGTTASTVALLAWTAWQQKKWKEAIVLYHQALPLFHKRGMDEAEGYALLYLGKAYLGLLQSTREAQPEQNITQVTVSSADIQAQVVEAPPAPQTIEVRVEDTIQFFAQALFELRNRPPAQISTLSSLMQAYTLMGEPEAAIIFGKQTINGYQLIRRANRSFDQQSQKTYLKNKEGLYRQLARLLIEQGRFGEADQVLSMLQQQEFLDFVNKDARGVRMESSQSVYQPEEQDTVDEQGDKITNLVALTGEATQLSAVGTPSEEQQSRLRAVRGQLKGASDDLDRFFERLPSRFRMSRDAAKQERTSLDDARTILASMNGKAAYIRVLVDDQGLELLVTRPGAPTVRLSYVPKAEMMRGAGFSAWLNTHINDFNTAILKREDVSTRARELYAVLFCKGQLATYLQGSGVDTLIWRMTGSMRSLPLAALHDGQKYLIEKYALLNLTAGSSTKNLTHVPKRNWRALGAGVSQARTIGTTQFDALPGAKSEMAAVIHDPADGFHGGVLPGRVLFNDKFTQSALLSQLRPQKVGDGAPYQLVHISSHFEAGVNSTQSFLLTGDKKPLTLADLQTLGSKNPLFPGVELVTLSACNTAKSVGSNGGQGADSLAALAELNGAKAVLATLWPVADKQTARIMADFYQLHKDNPKQTKLWALHQAQLKMLHSSGSSAQPYFWAPFVLMGNGR